MWPKQLPWNPHIESISLACKPAYIIFDIQKYYNDKRVKIKKYSNKIGHS